VIRKMGQLDFGGISSGMAKSLVAEAEGPTRKIIREERTKFAEAMIGGIPWAAASALAGIGTWYLIPDKARSGKALGYGTSAVLAGTGAIITAYNLREDAPEEAAVPAPAGAPTSGSFKSASDQAAASLVAAAEPKVRAIVAEERERISSAGHAGLPLGALGALALIATAFMVDEKRPWFKALGYAGAVGLGAAGAWVSLEKLKG
jgi:hypothetical protein